MGHFSTNGIVHNSSVSFRRDEPMSSDQSELSAEDEMESKHSQRESNTTNSSFAFSRKARRPEIEEYILRKKR